MNNKITNIEELYELVNPELLTTENSCHDMLDKLYQNKRLLDNYGKKVIKRLAKIKNEKVFYAESDYTVTYCDYFVAKDKEELNGLGDSLFDEVVDVHDSICIEDFSELRE